MIEYNYHKLLEEILEEGYTYEDPNRKGVNRKQINSYVIKHDFERGFPLISTKFVSFKSAVGEFLTFIKGDNTLGGLENNGVKFWRKDAYRWYNEKEIMQKVQNEKELLEVSKKSGVGLGKIYPYQMRNWNGEVDQLQELVNTLNNNPMATKKTVTMWNPSDKGEMCLSPCHWSFEALVKPLENDDKYSYGLTIRWLQHSCDVFLGIPFNIAYYSLMCYFLAEISGMKPMGVEGVLSNVHIYEPHLDAVKQQLDNDISKYRSPKFKFSIFAKELFKREKDLKVLGYISVDDFVLEGYESYPAIKAEMLTYS